MLEDIVEDVYNPSGVLDFPYFSMLIAPDIHGTMAFLDWTEILFSLIWRADGYNWFSYLLQDKWQICVLFFDVMNSDKCFVQIRYILVSWTFVDIIFHAHIKCHISFVENGSSNAIFCQVSFMNISFVDRWTKLQYPQKLVVNEICLKKIVKKEFLSYTHEHKMSVEPIEYCS